MQVCVGGNKKDNKKQQTKRGKNQYNKSMTFIYDSWVLYSKTKIKSVIYLLLSYQFESDSCRGVLDTTLCDKVCQGLAAGRWFSPCTLVSSTNTTVSHDIFEILLKVSLNTTTLTLNVFL